ncbi:MAG: Flp pilus assembly complex ATPase component [Gammaproteobacteria bacterium]|nr:Flp pilus assembly complex ATPase component [Gammaproteobacteria bacterium]
MFDVIIITDKGKNTKRVRCTIKQCTIGKSRDNLIVIRGWRIAPVHARLEMTEKGIYIEDLSDGVGTMVNGERIDYYGPLRSADTINICGYDFRVGIASGDDIEETPAHSSEPEVLDNKDWVMGTFIGQSIQAGDEETTKVNVEKQRIYLWRNRIHQELLRTMDLRRTDIGDMDEDELRLKVEQMIDEIMASMDSQLPDTVDRDHLKNEVLNEAVGLGPLEELLANDDVTEIMVNSYDDIYIEQKGKLTKSNVAFSSDEAVMSAIERIVSPLGRRIDESSPMVDARLADGSRVNAIIPPLALLGPCITIRKFAKSKLTDKDLIGFGTINENMVTLLKTAVEQRQNVVISGGTGSGKTTLLNILSNFIPDTERIVTVEDAAELKLSQPHLVSLESRPPNLEGKGAITIRDLVKNCLRMRPDRIVVGECRAGEALDMLQAMNTGHDGSLTTAHANSPRDVISRLEVMVMMSGMDLPIRAIREQISSAVNIVVQQSRLADGSRKVTHISEITGMEGDIVQLNDIFIYRQEGFDSDGNVIGCFTSTGQVPQFYEGLRARGIPIDMSIF